MGVTHLLLLIVVASVAAVERLTIEKVEAHTVSDNPFHTTQDNLFIDINDVKVWPKGYYHNIGKGQSVNPNIVHYFEQSARIELMEYDEFDANDFLGAITVTNQGKNYGERKKVVNNAQKSTYYVTYKVEHNAQDVNKKWMMCGVYKCKTCSRDRCAGESKSGLDRDKDKSDIRGCPDGYSHEVWRRDDQTWPAADVYLRICKPI